MKVGASILIQGIAAAKVEWCRSGNLVKSTHKQRNLFEFGLWEMQIKTSAQWKCQGLKEGEKNWKETTKETIENNYEGQQRARHMGTRPESTQKGNILKSEIHGNQIWVDSTVQCLAASMFELATEEVPTSNMSCGPPRIGAAPRNVQPLLVIYCWLLVGITWDSRSRITMYSPAFLLPQIPPKRIR